MRLIEPTWHQKTDISSVRFPNCPIHRGCHVGGEGEYTGEAVTAIYSHVDCRRDMTAYR